MSTSVSGSSTVNGLHSNPNQISGLVSGLDTESMIEGLVDSYNSKIIGFQQDMVLQEWKQEAYRDVINDLLMLSEKYTSFTSSSTNLASNAFFNSAVSTIANGTNSDAVSVSGTTSSDIAVDSVLQVATSGKVVSSQLADSVSSGSAATADEVDLSETWDEGTLDGTLKLTIDNKTVSLNFGSTDIIRNEEDLVNAINDKLATVTINGESASGYIKASMDENGVISFSDESGVGASPYISSVSGNLGTSLGITASSMKPGENGFKEESKTIDTSKIAFTDDEGSAFVETCDTVDALADKTMTVNYNGISTTLTIPDKEALQKIIAENDDIDNEADAITFSLNEQVQAKFGDAVSVKNDAAAGSDNLKLSFEIKDTASNNTLLVTSTSAGEILGFGGSSISSYLRTSDTLGDVVEKAFDGDGTAENATTVGDQVDATKPYLKADELTDLKDNEGYIVAVGTTTLMSDGSYVDTEGDKVVRITGNDGKDTWAKLDDDGKIRIGEELIINDVSVGFFDKESSIQDVVDAVNSSDAGVSVSFSSLTNNFVFNSKDTGSTSSITLNNTSLGNALFGNTEKDGDGKLLNDALTETVGQDAKVLVTVNGEQVQLTRSTNDIQIDGLTITVKSTFNNTTKDGDVVSDFDDANFNNIDMSSGSVTFTEETDFDPVIDVIKDMVDDYNTLMNKIRTLFTEVPLSSSSGGGYKPLTDEDSSSMTESAVEKYEEKAKTGLLFGDSNMRNLYNSMSSVFSVSGSHGIALNDMGFSVAYGTGTTGNMLDFDEDKLRDMLENNFETVKSVFTGTEGVMKSLSNTIDTYASVTGSSKGVLVMEAGSEASPMSLLENTMQTKLDTFQKLIEKWEEKLTTQVDYYTAQFTRLEVLMAEANSQSSALGDL